MAGSIGIDFGTRAIRLASSGDAKHLRPLGNPVPVWQAAGLKQEPLGDVPIKSRLDKAITIGRDPVFLADLALHVLQYVRAEAKSLLKADVDGCVISTAWQTGNMQREILRSTARKAGFKVVHLINDSAAVALSQCNPVEGERKIIVYSLGAGSLEVAVGVRARGSYRELAAGSLDSLSGNNLTWRLFTSLREELIPASAPESSALEAEVWQIAENAKKLLSSQDELRLERALPGRELVIGRSRLEGLIEASLSSSLELCSQLLGKAGLETPQELDEIWLAGQSTKIPLIELMVTSWSGKKPDRADEYAVALGAAMQAAHIEVKEDLDTGPAPEAAARPFSLFGLFRPSPAAFRTGPAASEAATAAAGPDQTAVARADEVDRRLAQEDFEGALDQLQEAMGFLQARRARVYLLWGHSLEAQGDLQQALSKYHQANQLDRGNPRIREALESIQKRVLEQEARSEYERGQQLEARGDLNNAVKSFQRAYEKNAAREYRLAYEQILRRKANQEIEQYNHFSQQRNRKNAEWALKRAREYVAECVRLDPGNREYRAWLDEVSAALRRV